MNHRSIARVIFGAYLVLGCACVPSSTSSSRTRIGDETLVAYGREWTLFTRLTTRKWLPIMQVMAGGSSNGEYELCMEDDHKQVFPVTSHISVLGKSGSYAKYRPADANYPYATVRIFVYQGRLYVQLIDKPSDVTDQPTHPPLPFVRDGKYKDGYRSKVGIYYGEFDPDSEEFYVHEFVSDFDKNNYDALKNGEGELMFFLGYRSDFTSIAR